MRARAAERMRARFPDRFYLEASRTHRPNEDVFIDGALALGEHARSAGRRDATTCASSRATTSNRTKRASASTRARARRSEAAARLHARAVPASRRRRWRSCSPTCRKRSRTRSRSRERCSLELKLGKCACRRSRCRQGTRIDSFIRDERARGPRARGSRKHAPAARHRARGLRDASRDRARRHLPDGLRRATS